MRSKRLKVLSFVFGAAWALSACGGHASISETSSIPTLLATATPVPTPSIITTYSLVNDFTSLNLTVSQNMNGKVYYAIYNADQGTLTASQVKLAAQASTTSTLLANGVVTVAAANTNYTTNISTLPDKQLYSIYAIGENGTTLAADASVKKYASVLPKGATEIDFAKVTGIHAGSTVRYLVHVPIGYYDHPSSNYPIILWIHGNGEAAQSDPSNTGADFSLMYNAGLFKRLYANVDDVPTIIIAAQCNYALFNCANQQQPDLHKETLDDAISKFRVDLTRRYVMGISYGGQGTITFANTYPTIPAAILTMATAAVESNATLCGSIGANNIPYWAFQNRDDPIFGSTSIQTTVQALQACTSKATAKARMTTFMPGSWPNTIEAHGSTENLTLGLPYNDGSWVYWNGSATVSDTVPPSASHIAPLAPEITTSTPGLTPLSPNIQMSSFPSASADLGVTINHAWDWLMIFHQ